jgi:hypothetical protein
MIDPAARVLERGRVMNDNNTYPEVKSEGEILFESITAEQFGKRLARVFLTFQSSNVMFFIQQAFGGLWPYGVEWEPTQKMLERIQGGE